MYLIGLVVDWSRQLGTGFAATMRNGAPGTPASAKPWSLALAAAIGVVTGVCIATIFHWSHDQPSYTFEELIGHFLPQVITFMMVLALLFVVAAIGWNQRKTREPSEAPPSYGQGLRRRSAPLR
jgi:hypothetical protein